MAKYFSLTVLLGCGRNPDLATHSRRRLAAAVVVSDDEDLYVLTDTDDEE
jgi:hypothetical protein